MKKLRRPKSNSAFITLAIVGTLSWPGGLLANTTWNLANDWSEAANPNGAWSLNSDSNPLPHVSGSTLPGGLLTTQPGWAACSSCRGFWFRAAFSLPNVDWAVGDIVLHTQDQYSNPYSHAANVTWTSPITGKIDITGAIWMDDFFASRGNQWNIYENNTLITSGQLSGSDAYDRLHPFDYSKGSGSQSALLGLEVKVGDMIRLEVVRTTRDGYFVSPTLTISAVPEPSQLALLSAGLGWLGYRSKLRAKAKTGS